MLCKRTRRLPQMHNVISNTFLIPPHCRERFLASSEDGGRILSSYGIDGAGISKLASPYMIGRTAPEFYVVLFCEEGTALFNTAESEWEMTKGEMVILPPGKSHLYQAAASWNIVWFHLHASHRTWSTLPDSTPTRRPMHDILALRSTMELFMDEQARRRDDADRVLEPLAHAISVLLERELCDQEPPELRRTRQEIEKAWRAVQADLAHSWTVEQLAKKANLSVSQLHRGCLKIHATSPMRWVRKMRIEQAAELLAFTPYTLTEIATQVGYETPFALSKAFRAETGSSPQSCKKRRQP